MRSPATSWWLSSGPPGHNPRAMIFRIEVEREEDGRWIAEVCELAGALAYGPTREEAVARAKAVALRAVAERLEHGEAGPDLAEITFRAA